MQVFTGKAGRPVMPVHPQRSQGMNIVIGCDHAAFQMKNIIRDFLKQAEHEVQDIGAFGPESVDYPQIGIQAATMVSKGEAERGILLCGTGLGMSMVANRFAHVRAALCNDLFAAAMSRRHNNANILVMGGRVIGDVLALEIVKTWLATDFEGDRHQRRLDMFDHLQS
jgi:ribose 5-phosphate isomerase B